MAEGLRCAPPNALPGCAGPHPHCTVVGAGKTGMDACLWLLQDRTAPARIRWIVPNDAWSVDRANVRPGVDNLRRCASPFGAAFAAAAEFLAEGDAAARNALCHPIPLPQHDVDWVAI